MLRSKGVWCDSDHFTDVGLLRQIAATYRDAAVGILTNRNITGQVAAEIAAVANLIVAHVDEVGGQALIGWRTPEDQVAIITAATNRSVPAARDLVAHMSPSGALLLTQMLQTSRLKGASELTQGLVALRHSTRYRLASHDPNYFAFLEASYELRGSDARDKDYLATYALGATSAEQLRNLAPTLARLGYRSAGGISVQTALLTATHRHPDVVRYWVEHAGGAGLVLAAMDYRQDPELLLSLPERAGGDSGLRDMLSRLLFRNQTVPWSALIPDLEKRGAALLADVTGTDWEARFDAWHREVKTSRNARLSGKPGERNVAAVVLKVLDDIDTPGAVVPAGAIKEAVNSAAFLSAQALELVLTASPQSRTESKLWPYLTVRRPDLRPVRPPLAEGAANASWYDFIHGTSQPDQWGFIVNPYAARVTATLRRPDQYAALHFRDEVNDTTLRNTSLTDKLAEFRGIHSEPPSLVASGLLPNALGSLD